MLMFIREQRIQRAIQAMKDQEPDMWIAYGNELMQHGEPMLRYLLTFDMFGPVAIILTREGEQLAINTRKEIEELESMSLFTSVVLNNDGAKGMEAVLAEIIQTRKPTTITLNFSEKDPTADGLSCLCKRPADDVFIEPGDFVNVDFGLSIEVVAVGHGGGEILSSLQDEIWLIP